jgi:hypothetical protein
MVVLLIVKPKVAHFTSLETPKNIFDKYNKHRNNNWAFVRFHQIKFFNQETKMFLNELELFILEKTLKHDSLRLEGFRHQEGRMKRVRVYIIVKS